MNQREAISLLEKIKGSEKINAVETMERLTVKSQSNCGFVWCIRTPYSAQDAVDRLAAYEDTGLEPEAVEQIKLSFMGKSIAEITEFEGIPIARLKELAQAEKDGRLVVLDKPREPLVWGDDTHYTILCPSCNHDLMGGFPEDEYCENPMYQCPYCGQPLDSTKAITREEAEAALEKREADDEAD